MGEEIAWFEQGSERVVAALIQDRCDRDFGGIIMGKDRRGRFRCVKISTFDASQRRAEVALRREMEAFAHLEDEAYYQGDESGEPLDFFTPVVSRDRLNPSFARIAESEGYSPAREIIKPMMHWFDDPDGNFVEQFQTGGFDARIWELYLFAAFSEMGYEIDRKQIAPDFMCERLGERFCVEATTVGPSQSGPLSILPSMDTQEGQRAFLDEFMPIKYGSALFSKFKKKYWESPAVEGRPFILAVADFQGGSTMIATRSSLSHYLYGYDYDWRKDEHGRLFIVPRRIETHKWNSKEIPSGFFRQPGTENISAVVFNNSATISKFLRMGKLAGFGSPRVELVRVGTSLDHDPDATDPIVFRHCVRPGIYSETWVEGLDVFHNPNAIHPVHEWTMPNASHHWLLPDNQMLTHAPDWVPFGSMTHIFVDTEKNLSAAV